MAQNDFKFHTHRYQILMHYTEDSIIFPYNRQYQSTPSLINNTDFDQYEDNNFESSSSKSSFQTIPLDQNNINSKTKYQNLHYSEPKKGKF